MNICSATLKPSFIHTPYRGVGHQVRIAKHLKDLNDAQYRAVTHPPNTSLQILAGPGTGKTKVLTARIVELIETHRLPPQAIHAVTFSRKASTEMRKRLVRDLGETQTGYIGLGTFHATCIRYIKEYNTFLNVPSNFSIWDEDACEILVWYLAQRYDPKIHRMQAVKINQRISSAKAYLSESPKQIFLDNLSSDDPAWIGDIFDDYQRTLQISNALDFEDLQSTCLDLFNQRSWIKRLTSLRHVLVDEFQDTSSRQYELTRKFFRATEGCITVVGDPDQSIYDWRNADNMNFDKMKQDLPETQTIALEENYRSTGSILAFSQAIIEQDLNRPEKSLYTSHTPNGPKTTLKTVSDETIEAEFMTNEIKRLVNTSDGLFGYGDFAILVRDNYTSKDLKSAFRESSIPVQVLPQRFKWEVPEVQILLAYLRLVVDPAYTPMVCRTLEGPGYVDKKPISKLVARGLDERRPVFEVLQRVCNGVAPDTEPSIKKQGHDLVKLIRHLQEMEAENASSADLLQHVRTVVKYDQFLEKRSPDWAHLHKNMIDQLIELAKEHDRGENLSPIRSFLKWLSIVSKIPRVDPDKVSILTCHSAKGLEWPIVFVPQVVDGVHPSNMTDNIDEARRLLYVACTRAQCLLYLSLSKMKMVGRGDNREPLRLYPSPFIDAIKPLESYVSSSVPHLHQDELQLFRNILGKPVVSIPK